MIDRSHTLPLVRQARELGISRGSVYYLPKPVSAADLAIMRRIDELHLEFPFAGSRMLRDLLRQEGIKIGRLIQIGAAGSIIGGVTISAFGTITPERGISDPPNVTFFCARSYGPLRALCAGRAASKRPWPRSEFRFIEMVIHCCKDGYSRFAPPPLPFDSCVAV